MPELVAGGPSIPVRLLNELDSGKVVFFCGAGISAGPESGLPGFEDLVKHVYKANHLKPDEVEREALDCGEQDPSRRRPSYDKALGLLERPGRLKPRLMRHSVIKRLWVPPPPKSDLHVHKALIDLSRTERGVRLVTTNFDNRFKEAGLDEHLIDAAPKLPVPKRYAWSSVVQLHGRITKEDDDGSNLVLTAADFGRAYLTERWAARFITEMFREFTVVFVGYSLGDPVMSYMVDALAAEAAKGAQFFAAYAFASYEGSDIAKQRVRDGWRAKNVWPLLYDESVGHGLLAETLKEWARIRSDPFYAPSRIAINEITKMPTGVGDPIVERVTWALQVPGAAKALADEPPIVDEDDFSKLEKWLDVLTEQGLFGCATNDTYAIASNREGGIVRLVEFGFVVENPYNLDTTRVHLARWLARHLHVPQLLTWVLRNGGHLHPGLKEEVRRVLAKEDARIHPQLRFFWTVLLDNRSIPHSRRHLWTDEHYRVAASDSERRQIEDEVVESIAPCLVVRAGPPQGLELQQYSENRPRSMALIDACGHIKLVSGDDSRHHLDPILNRHEVLVRHAETFTSYLEKALSLGVDDSEVYSNSILYRPSIAAHDQNFDDDDWTHLIDLARDSYLALASVSRQLGANLLQRWIDSDQALFKRLALHALTENTKSDIQLARKLLLAGRKPGIWEPELHREALRFLRLAGKRLPGRLRVEIVRAIHVGPKRSKGTAAEAIRYQKALRLQKLSDSGARLDKKSQALAAEISVADELGSDGQDEFLVWGGEGRIIGAHEFAPRELVQGSVADVAAALKNESVDTDGFRGVAVKHPVKATSALRRLSKRGIWPAKYWQQLLWFLSTLPKPPERNTRLQCHVAQVLVAAPQELFNSVGTAAASFVKRIAEEFGTNQEEEIGMLWERAWSNREEITVEEFCKEDPLTEAMNHPAGELADAALIRLGKYELQPRAGFPLAVHPYFKAVAEDPNGHFGRVMLATRLCQLFALDPEWTAKHLVARLSPEQSEEAFDLWSAYGWSLTISPDLLQAVKEPFLEILRDRSERVRKPANLWKLFLTVCLEARGELAEPEIRGVVETMSEMALVTLIGGLRLRLKGEAAERAAIWHDKVHPWLRAYWPREANRNTKGTSESILIMLVESGDAFPCAVEWSLDYLRPLEGRGLYDLLRSGQAKQHAERVLEILDRVVDAEVLPIHQRDPLRRILDALAEASSEIRANRRFLSLYQIATG